MKVILDANVLIAAVAGRGLCESVLELCLEQHSLIISEELLYEVHRNLIDKIKLPEAVSRDFCNLLRENSFSATPEDVDSEACRDPEDLHLLGLSKATGADFLITGDRDLIESAWNSSTRIITPRQFWEICGQK